MGRRKVSNERNKRANHISGAARTRPGVSEYKGIGEDRGEVGEIRVDGERGVDVCAVDAVLVVYEVGRFYL